MSTNIVAFVIVLGILIFFHELGHFLIARLFGVGVEKFSLGFGPRIFGKTVGITDYRVSAIPLGGYVKMVGDEPGADIDPEDIHLSFTHKPISKKMLIVAAGPFFNLFLAVIIFLGVFLISGLYVLKPSIGGVGEGTPAEKQGLKKGDVIVAIDKAPVEAWDEMAVMISESGGKMLVLTIEREKELLDINITPNLIPSKNLFGEDIERYVIGITAGGESFNKKIGVVEAFSESLHQTYRMTELTIISIVKLIQGTLSRKTLGGPIMIAQMAGQQARAGAESLLVFIAVLSVNLAVLNFLPIPVLDGGHLMFFTIEAIIRRPVNIRAREIAQQIGIFILLLLMIYVFYNDINRLIFS
jgi:regulator of sigma E protease